MPPGLPLSVASRAAEARARPRAAGRRNGIAISRFPMARQPARPGRFLRVCGVSSVRAGLGSVFGFGRGRRRFGTFRDGGPPSSVQQVLDLGQPLLDLGQPGVGVGAHRLSSPRSPLGRAGGGAGAVPGRAIHAPSPRRRNLGSAASNRCRSGSGSTGWRLSVAISAGVSSRVWTAPGSWRPETARSTSSRTLGGGPAGVAWSSHGRGSGGRGTGLGGKANRAADGKTSTRRQHGAISSMSATWWPCPVHPGLP